MGSLSVLIIDDEKDICFLLGKILKEKNYKVLIANDLKDGFAKLAESKPSILFLDIRLPDGSSLDAISTIRKQNPDIKIIMMSAYDGVHERSRATKEGADLFIGKPLDSELIKSTLLNLR